MILCTLSPELLRLPFVLLSPYAGGPCAVIDARRPQERESFEAWVAHWDTTEPATRH